MTSKLANNAKTAILTEIGVYIPASVPTKQRVRAEGPVRENDQAWRKGAGV